MTTKLMSVMVLVAFGLGGTQTEAQTFQGLFLHPEIRLKELEATFSSEPPQSSEFFRPSREEQQDNNDSSQVESTEQKIFSGFPAAHSEVLAESSDDRQKPAKRFVPNEAERLKRQTSLTGNGNRLSNLINLPTRLNVLANILSHLNQGVIDSEKPPLNSLSISGNNNTVASVLNAPLDVDAVFNMLSKVEESKPQNATLSGSDGGVVSDLLANLLGGAGEAGNKGLVSGLLDGLLGKANLGHTLNDLLRVLLANDGLVGNTLGAVNGKHLVSEILDKLLTGVAEMLDNLLDLLVGLLEGLPHDLQDTKAPAAATDSPRPSENNDGSQTSASQGLNIQGNNNRVSSLISAPTRVKALLNVLSTLKKEITQHVEPADAHQGAHIQGHNNEVSSLINVPLDLDLEANLLSSLAADPLNDPSVKPTAKGSSASPPHTTNGEPSADPAATQIKGNNNVLSSLLNVVPDVKLNLNLLSEVTDLLGASNHQNATTQDTSHRDPHENNPNEICFDIPITQADTSVTGDNNTVLSAINIKPKISIDLNLLSKTEQTENSNAPTQRVCIIRPTQPSTTISPASSGSQPSLAIQKRPLAPKVTTTIPAKPAPAIPEMSQSTARPPAQSEPRTPSSSNSICFDVLVDDSGTVVNSDHNYVSSVVNLDPETDLAVKLLSDGQVRRPPAKMMVKRVCLPDGPSPYPTDLPPLYSPALSHCVRRACTKWRQFVDYNCVNKASEYPKITYTMDI